MIVAYIFTFIVLGGVCLLICAHDADVSRQRYIDEQLEAERRGLSSFNKE